MRYLLIQSREEYREYPLAEDKEYEGASGETACPPISRDEASNKKLYHDERVFCLSGERHMFERGENVSISSGEEAVIRIPLLKSRLYIREMRYFFDGREGEYPEYLYLNQRRLPAGEAVLCPGDVLFLKNIKIEVWGERVIIWGDPGDYSTSMSECPLIQRPDGFPVYKRSPRLMKKPSADKILLELPKERERQDRRGFLMNVLPSVGMTIVTVAVGVVTGRGIYLVMSAVATGMTAIFSGIRYIDEKRTLKRNNQKHTEYYLDYLWHKQKAIAAAYEREKEVYAYRFPGIDDFKEMVREYDSRIYERVPSDEDFLTAAVGHYLGKTGFVIEGKEPSWDAGKDELTQTVRDIRKKYAMIDRPRVVDLKKAHLGMTGEKEILHRQIKMLTAQIACFHSYHDLRMIVIYNEEYEDEFRWMRWLPHVRIPALNIFGMVNSERKRDLVLGSISRQLKERAERLREGEKESKYLPHYLFLIQEPYWIMEHGIMEYLRMDGNVLGFSVIYLSDVRANLPEYISTVLQIENSQVGRLLLDAGEYENHEITLYQTQDVDFEWLARDLSMVEHEQGITSYIPESVTFFEMYKVRRPEELEIHKRWRENRSYRSLAVPVGMRSADEPMILNLHEKAHGPHGLVAGTTGSGKSELIQSYILSLAVNFHPYEVGFLLIDYKGGGMANLFCRLPHHLGTITNLDGAGSMRALISVKAELSRRQKIFADFQVNHINGYMKLFKEGKASEPIPHLFIVSDEFAELKKEQPDFMKELVSAARIGRSLGVHLILATQKPAGIVDEQILSNSRFRMCLKVQNESDSKEILKTPDAANITLPGRAYIQVGNNEVYEMFQSAWSGAAYREIKEQGETEDERVYVVNEFGQGELINQDLSGKKGEYRTCVTQLEAVAALIGEIFKEERVTGVKKPWLSPLKKMIVSPYAVIGTEGEREAAGVAGKSDKNKLDANMEVSLGKVDIPEMQEQRELKHNFAKEGNLLFVASAGFGKTTFLTTVLTSLAILNDVDNLNYYILDYGNNGCLPLKGLPHTAEYISLDDEERYWKFKKLITEEITLRKRLFAGYAAASWEAYQELSKETMKIIVIAIDQFDVVKEAGIEEEEFFTKITRDGAGLGIYTIASTNRVNGIRQATLNNFNKKIAGYTFDENETFQVVGRTAYRQADIKGRALVGKEDVHEAQIYAMAPCKDQTMYGRALKELTQKIRRKYQDKEAPHIPVLPSEFSDSMMSEYENDGSSYLVGLEVEEVVLKGFERSAGLFVIIGNTGTGKTNILRVLADQAVSKGRVCLFDSRSMGMYDYSRFSNVLYIGGKTEADLFVEEISGEVENRRQFLKERLHDCQGISPKKLIEEMPFYTILIDDSEDFTELMKGDLERAASFIKEGSTLGITCIVTVHAAKSRGMGTMDKLIRQAAEGIVLSSQGVVPIFPVSSVREYPKFGEGLLFRNGVYQRVRLPRYDFSANTVLDSHGQAAGR